MFWDAVPEGEEFFQPGFLSFPVFFDVLPPFGKSHDGQKGDNDNFCQGIGFVPFDSWAFDMLEEVE
jgi:hypothetical protein